MYIIILAYKYPPTMRRNYFELYPHLCIQAFGTICKILYYHKAHKQPSSIISLYYQILLPKCATNITSIMLMDVISVVSSLVAWAPFVQAEFRFRGMVNNARITNYAKARHYTSKKKTELTANRAYNAIHDTSEQRSVHLDFFTGFSSI